MDGKSSSTFWRYADPMVWIRHHSFQTGLLTALLVSLGAFVVFHGIGALQFSHWFARWSFESEHWLEGILALEGRLLCLYGVGAVLCAMAYFNARARFVYFVFGIVTLTSAYWFHYPAITVFLYLTGQFPDFPTYLFDGLPSTWEFLGPSRFE